ncbi:visinin-like protein 1 [Ciona intestinalis]
MGQKAAKLNPAVLKDLYTSTYYSEGEIKEWYSCFRKECPTGYLTRTEFVALYKKMFVGDSSQFAEQAFRTYDRDGSGEIDFREFMCALSLMSRGTVDEKLTWAFNMYDVDGDGEITRVEMRNMIRSVYLLVGEDIIYTILPEQLTPQQRADRIFSRMDKDGDEQVTLKEFLVAARLDPSLVMLLQIGD